MSPTAHKSVSYPHFLIAENVLLIPHTGCLERGADEGLRRIRRLCRRFNRIHRASSFDDFASLKKIPHPPSSLCSSYMKKIRQVFGRYRRDRCDIIHMRTFIVYGAGRP
jgi:hypothetical protein